MKNLLTIIFIIFSFLSISQDVIKFTDEPENLGPNINSSAGELGPVISPDGKTLYVCRDNHVQNMGGQGAQSIWYSTLKSDGTWGKLIQMPSPLNNNSSNWINAITPDGNTILLGKKYNYYNGTTSNGVSLSYRDDRGWRYPKAQIIEKFENKNKYTNYYLSNDGEILFMSIEKKKGYGDLDIWVSFKKQKEPNRWTVPLNLGPTINTKLSDSAPFLAADGKTLYFASKGQEGGFGGADVWVSKRLDDSWTNWSKPVNMGDKINTSGWDSYFTIPASGEYAYFVSSKSGYGEEDIFRIKMPTEAKPEPVVLVHGLVLDKKTNLPLKSNISYELLPSGKVIGTAASVKGEGKYTIALPKGNTYGFSAKADGYYAISENLDLTNLGKYKEFKRDIYLVPIEKDEVIRLNNIFFETGKSTLKEESYPELNRLVTLLNDNEDLKIEISGHTDNIGSEEDNLILSQGRAEAVVKYLKTEGIKSSRITPKGYGESSPVSTNETEKGKALNRRVEFKIL